MWDYLKDKSPEGIINYSASIASEFDKDAAEFLWSGKVFVSHTSADSSWCWDNIVQPLNQKFGFDTCFFLNRYSSVNPHQNHFDTIEPACRNAKTVIMALSQNSHRSEWMPMEARWAIEQTHPIIICSRDEAEPSLLREEFAHVRRPAYAHLPIELVDFQQGNATARLLDLMALPQFQIEPMYAHPCYPDYNFFDDFGWGDQFTQWRKAGKPPWRNGKPVVR